MNVIHTAVRNTLIEFAKEFCDLKPQYGFHIVPPDNRPNSHRGCCFCETCGLPTDNECVCEHNRIVKWIKDATGDES